MPEASAWPATRVFAFLLLHLPLAVMLKRAGWLAGMHAWGTAAIGLWLCTRPARPGRILAWMGYVVGAEVLWRMSQAPVPWQFAEYLLGTISAVLAWRAKPGGGLGWPAGYLMLLMPACLIPLANLPFAEARQAVSFNLSGPWCFVLCAWCCSHFIVDSTALEQMGVALLGPIGGVAFLAFLGAATEDAGFGTSANLVASGGFGPNQVSALLSLGALMAVFLYLSDNRTWLWRLLWAGLAPALLAQSALTFSRTGLYLFGSAFGVAAALWFQVPATRRRVALLVGVLAIATVAGLPLLDVFTGGRLIERFSNFSSTGRGTIASQELEIWQAHVMLGAGAGMSEQLRGAMGDARPAHTEYTRLLAEHGLAGLAAGLILLGMVAHACWRTQDCRTKALWLAFATWSLLFMAASAMRLAAPAFLLGMIQARFAAKKPTPNPARRAGRDRRPGIPTLSSRDRHGWIRQPRYPPIRCP